MTNTTTTIPSALRSFRRFPADESTNIFGTRSEVAFNVRTVIRGTGTPTRNRDVRRRRFRAVFERKPPGSIGVSTGQGNGS